MASRSGPGKSWGDPVLSVIVSERHRVISLACRLLGWLTDAEDAVRESSARWHAMSAQRREAIGSRWLADHGRPTASAWTCSAQLGAGPAGAHDRLLPGPWHITTVED